jgi:FixJ family two-component response regulator
MTPIEEAAGRQPQDTGRGVRDDGPFALLVDDDDQWLSAHARILTRHGYGVETAKDVDTALIALQRRSFDVLVSDITMPRLSGIDLLQQIRADGNDIPVVLVTGDPQLDTAIGAVEHGAVRYIAKPLGPGVLVRAVGQAVRLQKIARANRLALDNTVRETFIQELKKAKNEAEASSRAKGELLAKMGDELRVAVNAVIGTTERARNAELTLEQHDYLIAVVASAGSLIDVVQHVLDALALLRGDSGAPRAVR